jgi:hypothetical protein
MTNWPIGNREFEEGLTGQIKPKMDKHLLKLMTKNAWIQNFNFGSSTETLNDKEWKDYQAGYSRIPVRMHIVEELLANKSDSDFIIAKGIVREQRKSNKLVLLYHDLRTTFLRMPKKYIK